MSKIKFGLLLLIMFLTPFSKGKSDEFSPSKRTWFFEGSEEPPMTMFFKEDGSVEIRTTDSKPVYSWLGPVSWSYSAAKKELTFTLPKATSNYMKRLKKDEGRPSKGYKRAKRVDVKLKQITYDFPNRISFLDGPIFEEKTP